ncbi:MAG: S-layer homology domain-containing protein [Thermoleophilia bacterium]
MSRGGSSVGRRFVALAVRAGGAILVVMLVMVLGHVPSALGKSTYVAAADPANDAVVLNVGIGDVVLPYTWGDMNGVAGYKFAGRWESQVYANVDTEGGGWAIRLDSCWGIRLGDVLSSIEETLNMTLQDDYRITVITDDGAQNEAFSVGEAKDYARHHYMLATRVNDVSEARLSTEDPDSSAAYAASYLRVARKGGGDQAAGAGDGAVYMERTTALRITQADGSAVPLPKVELARSNGVDLGGLSPATAGLVIGGTGISQGKGLLGSFVYLDKAQVDFIKATRSVNGLGLGNSWTEKPILYSSYHNHGTPEYTYSLVEGVDLGVTLSALGVDVAGGPMVVEAVAGGRAYAHLVNDAFGVRTGRNYIAPDGTVGAAVGPMLVFYSAEARTALHPDPSVVLPTATSAVAEPSPLFVYGQTHATEANNCGFVKDTCKIRAGSDVPALKVTEGSTSKTISLSDIALLGIYHTSYFGSEGDAHFTHNVVGVPLTKVLSSMGFGAAGGRGVTVHVDDGNGVIDSSRVIGPEEQDRCFVAYDAFESGQRVEGSVRPLRIYCPGLTRSDVVIENVVGVTIAVAPSWSDLSADTLSGYGVSLSQLAGISRGYEDGTFRPHQSILRSQFVKMATATFAIAETHPTTATFSDVPADHFYFGYIEGAYASQLVNGIGDGLFAPDITITREQALAIIARRVASQAGFDLAAMTEAEITSTLATFGDHAAVSSSLRDEMAFAVRQGITRGTSAGNLAPQEAISRLAAATMLIRADGSSWS